MTKLKKSIAKVFTYMGFEIKRKIFLNSPEYKIFCKNNNINNHINRFIKEFKSEIVPRENYLKPEVLIPCFNQGRYLKDALGSINRNDIDITLING